MSREWKPGDVAIVLQSGCERLAFRNDADWIDSMGAAWDDDEVSKYGRPIVAIDPEDREAVERLSRQMVEQGLIASTRVVSLVVTDLRDALHQFADPKPPRPDEPSETFSIVEDDEGHTWCLMPEGGWKCETGRFLVRWDDLPAVKVLSEGVR